MQMYLYAMECASEVLIFVFGRPEYLSLPVQAIECKLANVKPTGKLCSFIDRHCVSSCFSGDFALKAMTSLLSVQAVLLFSLKGTSQFSLGVIVLFV